MRALLRLRVLLALALCALASLPAHAQWAIDYSVRYEASGQQTGKPGERRGPDTLVSEKTTWRVQQEVRGTLNYTQKVHGAVASNMPDKNNEQHYDSWISRSGRAGDGPSAAKLNDPFVQIDRVDSKLHFEPPAIEFDPAQVRTQVEKVTRMDKPAAAGEWDRSDAKSQRTTAQLSLPLLPVQVFDMPRDAQAFEATRTIAMPGPTGGKATMTISLRRAGTAAADALSGQGAAATAPAATRASTSTEAPAAATTARAKADCPR